MSAPTIRDAASGREILPVIEVECPEEWGLPWEDLRIGQFGCWSWKDISLKGEITSFAKAKRTLVLDTSKVEEH